MQEQTEHTMIMSPLETISRAGSRVEISTANPNLRAFNAYQSMGGFGSMHFQHHAGNGFDIWYSNYSFLQRDRLTSRANIPTLELHIPIRGQFDSRWDGCTSVVFREKQFELSYAPFINHVSEIHAGERFDTFDIHYSKVYLQRFAYYPVMAKFLEKVEKGEPANLLNTSQFLSPPMIRLVNEVLHYNMHESMAPHFYEASALMMLTMALDRVSGKEKPIVYTAYDQECTTYARDLMTTDLSRKYSIKDLARHTGINETKLQLCFKQLFGTTIFDYHQSTRLEHATQLLLTTNLTIQSIAEACGYHDAPNLTAAFRNRYGCTPEYYRKNKNS